MNQNSGWVKIHRSILDWEWFGDTNTFKFFMYCIIRANHEDTKWQGISIKRGSFISSYEHMSKDTKLSIRNIRTALKHLKTTNEVTYRSTNQYSIITINNYDTYQANDKPSDKQATSERQTDDKQVTTDKNDKNDKNEKNNNTVKIDSLEKFVKYKQQILKIAKEKYPKKDCDKAYEDFYEYCEIHGKKYSKYVLAYFKWIRTDLKNEYGKKASSEQNVYWRNKTQERRWLTEEDIKRF